MWNLLKSAYVGIENAIARGWVNVVTKNGAAYKALPGAQRGGAVTASMIKARAGTRTLFATVGTAVGGWLAYVGINWTAKKADDASATLGFLTIVASLTAIGVAATLVLRKK